MLKRKFEEVDDGGVFQNEGEATFKNSLDSDESDDEATEEKTNVMNANDLEDLARGAEDGFQTMEGFTSFNMREELEEGYFNKEGHYVWKKDKELRDNWLDNIDWVKIKSSDVAVKESKKGSKPRVLGESDSEDDEADIVFDPIPLYKKIVEYLKPGETVSKALCRLGKGKKKMSTAERWKKKKEGIKEPEDENSVQITNLTELANELLTRTGNMDIYQESYEQIQQKIKASEKHSHPSKQEAELDMYADDFDDKEKSKLTDTKKEAKETTSRESSEKSKPEEEKVTWELKWSQEEKAEVHGPHTSEQMQAWAKEGYFKKGAFVRRTGQQSQFYNAARVDFELYL